MAYFFREMWFIDCLSWLATEIDSHVSSKDIN